MGYIFPKGFFSETLPTDNSPLKRLFSDDIATDIQLVLSAPERDILRSLHTIANKRKTAEIVKNGGVSWE